MLCIMSFYYYYIVIMWFGKGALDLSRVVFNHVFPSFLLFTFYLFLHGMIGFFIHGFYVEMSSFRQLLSLTIKVNESSYRIVLYHACVCGIRFSLTTISINLENFTDFISQHLLSRVQ